MKVADVNHLLRRPLQNGNHYDWYFIHSTCKPSYLGTNDTAFTMHQMQKWAYKNAHQTKDLALGEFRGLSLSKTADAIYRFLYGHIQYKVDGRRQNLKSPACAWATRDTGADCKTYSIFASTLLTNLGIKHYFRRVKQPGETPERWTHVYVVVPKNQKTLKMGKPEDYHVIDATLHTNSEVPFLKKHDLLMSKVSLPHYGLQSPSIAGLGGCSCTPKTVEPKPILISATTTMPAPSPEPTYSPKTSYTTTLPNLEVQTALRGPCDFGLGRSEVNLLGLDNNLSRQGSTSQNNQNKAETYTTMALSAYQAAAAGAAQNRQALAQGTREQRLAAINQGGAVSTAIKTIGAAAAPYTYGITALLALVPNEWYEKVLGQWFKDGFKCIGASWTPTKAKTVLNIEGEYLKSEAVKVFSLMETGSASEIEKAINDYMVFFYSVRTKERDWLDHARDCTRDGLILLVKGLDEAKKQIVSQFKNTIAAYGHELLDAGTKSVTFPADPSIDQREVNQKVEQFRIKVNQPVGSTSAQSSKSSINPQKAGFSTSSALLLAALAGGAYLYMSN